MEYDPEKDYIEGLAHQVKAAEANLKFIADGSKGMHVPFHGDLAGINQHRLNRLKWWLREIRRQRDEMLIEIMMLEERLEKYENND